MYISASAVREAVSSGARAATQIELIDAFCPARERADDKQARACGARNYARLYITVEHFEKTCWAAAESARVCIR